MNVKRNAVVLGIALLAGFFSTAQSGEFFTDQGSIWAGGTISYGIEYDRNGPAPVNMINLSPLIRFFPCKYLVLSPAFSWGTEFETYTDAGSTYSYSEGTFVIGPEVGFAYGNNIHVVPYVISGSKIPAFLFVRDIFGRWHTFTNHEQRCGRLSDSPLYRNNDTDCGRAGHSSRNRIRL